VTSSTASSAAPRFRRQLQGWRSGRQLRPRLVVVAFLAYLIGLVCLLPYIEMLISAGRPTNQLLDRDYLPSNWNWSVFVDIWGSAFSNSLLVSLEIASGATLLVLLVAVPAAYYTARNRFRGRAAFLLLVLVTQMFQPTAMLVGLYREFLSLGMLNSVFALILINAGFNMAFTVWILNAYISAIPMQLEEAAWMDGASRLGAFFRITIPLAMPGIVTSVIFTFIAAWNEFVVALTLTTSSASAPLTVALNGYIGEYKVDWNHLFAGSVIATVPVVILFAMIEGKVVSGLTSGGLK
jgi:multiple sugar transport system permease protein